LLLCVAALPLAAQIPVAIPQEAQLRAYLGDRDIDEAELRKRLETMGIQVDNLTPEQALQLRPQVEAVIAEMEAERQRAEEAARTAGSRAAVEIEAAVKDGAAVEEAI